MATKKKATRRPAAVTTLERLQDEVALWHAALVIGSGYDFLKERHPELYRRMHRVAGACVAEASRRAKEG